MQLSNASPQEGVDVEVRPVLNLSTLGCTSLPDRAVAFAAIWDNALPPHNAGKLDDAVVGDLLAPPLLARPPQALASILLRKLILQTAIDG